MVYKVCLMILVQVQIAIVKGDDECSTFVDPSEQCSDTHAVCRLNATLQQKTCQCLDGYKYSNGRCRAEGTPLPGPDYDSDWQLATTCNQPPYCDFYHGFNETPVIVEVLIDDHGLVFHAMDPRASTDINTRNWSATNTNLESNNEPATKGFRPDEDVVFDGPNFVVYIYDNQYINVSTTIPFGGTQYGSRTSDNYLGYGTSSDVYYSWIRARAWKLSSLPDPDFFISEETMTANTSKSEDSFYEVNHELGEHPGLVVVRARMVHNGSTFYADGVGSALNVFNDSSRTNAYLVYGFSDASFRVWVDSSTYGAIFDGRKYTRFDWMVSEAVVEIFAWKLSTITPYFTRRVSLDFDEFDDVIQFPIKFRISEGLTVAFAEIDNSSAINNGYRFPTTGYMARRPWIDGDDCQLGGARFGFYHIPEYFLILSETSGLNKWWINIPREDGFHAGLLCIPQTFGNGTKAERANGGTLLVYSWVDDCDAPTQPHATFDTSVNGTEVWAYAQMKCDVGYTSQDNLSRCSADNEWWYGTECSLVRCDEYKELANGTSTDNGTAYGSMVTFDCNEGFVLLGDAEITCQADGTWSGNNTHCEYIEEKSTATTTVSTAVIIIIVVVVVVVVVAIATTVILVRKCRYTNYSPPQN